MSTTNDPYIAFRPFGISDLRMNQILFVLYNRFISLAVDLIHCILYFNFVMSSWCLSDLPVSGQITALAISGKMTLSVFWVDGWLILVLTEMEKTVIRFCQSFSHNVLRQIMLSCAASHHTMRCVWCNYSSVRCLLPSMRIRC
jgi:hypothetical protein